MSGATIEIPLQLPMQATPTIEMCAYRWLVVRPNIAKRFSFERKRLLLTRVRIAETMNRGIDTVARYEKGSAIPVKDFVKLIDLGIDIGYILSGEHKHARHLQIYRSPSGEPFQRLKEERERLRFMAREVAQQMGCDIWTLRAYEKGKVGISTDVLTKLCNAGYDCHFLLSGERYHEKLQLAVQTDDVRQLLERVVPIDDRNRRIAATNQEWQTLQAQARFTTFGAQTTKQSQPGEKP